MEKGVKRDQEREEEVGVQREEERGGKSGLKREMARCGGRWFRRPWTQWRDRVGEREKARDSNLRAAHRTGYIPCTDSKARKPRFIPAHLQIL